MKLAYAHSTGGGGEGNFLGTDATYMMMMRVFHLGGWKDPAGVDPPKPGTQKSQKGCNCFVMICPCCSLCAPRGAEGERARVRGVVVLVESGYD